MTQDRKISRGFKTWGQRTWKLNHKKDSYRLLPTIQATWTYFYKLFNLIFPLWFQTQIVELDDQYGHFNAELTSIKVWLDKVRGQLAESDALSEEQQVSAQELEKYKVRQYCRDLMCANFILFALWWNFTTPQYRSALFQHNSAFSHILTRFSLHHSLLWCRNVELLVNGDGLNSARNHLARFSLL